MIGDWWANHPDARVVVLDDDPTGTQTVHDVTVLLKYDESLLATTLQNPKNRLTFLLTNSRSLLEAEAVELAERIGATLSAASAKAGVELIVVSRSDSTLRGHYPAEVDALLRGAGDPDLPHILMPTFLDGGRVTVDGVHYVRDGDQNIPVGETEFARDATFGFTSSRMDEWVEEKTKGRIRAAEVVGLSGSATKMQMAIEGLRPRQVAYVNAAESEHVNEFAEAYLAAWDRGKRPVLRTAASIVPVLSANETQDLWRPVGEPCGLSGLVVAGSYVGKTTTQLERVRARFPHARWFELNPRTVMEGDVQSHIHTLAEQVNASLGQKGTTVLATGRELLRGKDAAESREFGRRIADALNQVVAQINTAPSFILAKGGITSSDVAGISLGARSAWVLGQILPGVPVWRLDKNSRFPDSPYVVFPGNVGGPDAVADALEILQNDD